MSIEEWAGAVPPHELAEHPGLLDSEPMRVDPGYRQQVEQILTRDVRARFVASEAAARQRPPGCALLLAVLGGALVFALYDNRHSVSVAVPSWLLAVAGALFLTAVSWLVLPLRTERPLPLRYLQVLATLDVLAALGLWRATAFDVAPGSPSWILAAFLVGGCVALTAAAAITRARSTSEQRGWVEAEPERRAARLAEITLRSRARIEELWVACPPEQRDRIGAQRRIAFEVLHRRGLLDDVATELARAPGLRLLEEHEG